MPVLDSILDSVGWHSDSHSSPHAEVSASSMGMTEGSFEQALAHAHKVAGDALEKLAWAGVAVTQPLASTATCASSFLSIPELEGQEHTLPSHLYDHHIVSEPLDPSHSASAFLLLKPRATSFSLRWYAPVDEAEASSTYGMSKMNVGGKRAFAVDHSLRAGSGYWCSAGGHGKDEEVTWKGKLRHRRAVKGIKVSWAYAPGEVQVKTTPDGLNWYTAVSWHTAPRKEVTYEEDLLFDRKRNVKELEINMRSPKQWGFYGIHQVALEM